MGEAQKPIDPAEVPTAWVCYLERAIAAGDHALECEAMANLRRLGVSVAFSRRARAKAKQRGRDDRKQAAR
jgi:hypothetical protein